MPANFIMFNAQTASVYSQLGVHVTELIAFIFTYFFQQFILFLPNMLKILLEAQCSIMLELALHTPVLCIYSLIVLALVLYATKTC